MNIKSKDSYAQTKKSSSKWLLLCLMFVFFMTCTTVTVMELRNLYSDEPSVVRIIINSFKSSEESELLETSSNKFVLVNVENQQDTQELLKSIISQEEFKASQPERKSRETSSDKSSVESKNSYYEEQTPVVVFSKSEPEIPLSYRQAVNGPPKQDSNEEEPFGDAAEGRQEAYYDSDEQGYNGEQEQQQQGYYSDHEQQQPYYRTAAEQQYYDDSGEDFPGPNTEQEQQQESEEGRSAQQGNHDAYYRQWHYATPRPFAAGGNRRISSMNNQENHKLQSMTLQNQQNRDPYSAYMDDYEYMPPRNQMGSQHMQQHHAAASSSQALQKPEEPGNEMSLLSILKTLKTMWDLYQSFASSWNTIAQRHNKQEELAKQKYKQQMQTRIKANKQQQKLNNNNNKKNQERPTKNPKKQTTSTTTTTTTPSTTLSTEETASSEEQPKEEQQKQSAKVEPRKGSKGDNRNSKDIESLREKRQISDNTQVAETTDVGEGRYIKGDPLKGYYDFVITEGSYKFWAVFQVGTALLIIYSTFAAIYYSKVNPLVSDYDYTDYLGGGRSLSGGDLDFVDDETANNYEHNGQQKTWFDWLPRTGHSLKFILDAIDKLPADLDNVAALDNGNVNTNNDKEIKVM